MNDEDGGLAAPPMGTMDDEDGALATPSVGTMDDEDDDSVECLLPYKGYLYVSKCTDGPLSLRTLWNCTKPGCKGQVYTMLALSSDQMDNVISFSFELGNRILEVFELKEHDHPATNADHGVITSSNTVEKTKLLPIDSKKTRSGKTYFKMMTTNNNTNNQLKTKPVKLNRCKTCFDFILVNNNDKHLETISHRLSVQYLHNKYVQINRKQHIDCIVSCRIISPAHDRIDDFFSLIESNVLDIVGFVIKFGESKFYNVDLIMYAIYDDLFVEAKHETLGNVKKFMIKDQAISRNTLLLNWFQGVSIKFKAENLNYLNFHNTKFLSRVLFFDINFNEVTSVTD